MQNRNLNANSVRQLADGVCIQVPVLHFLLPGCSRCQVILYRFCERINNLFKARGIRLKEREAESLEAGIEPGGKRNGTDAGGGEQMVDEALIRRRVHDARSDVFFKVLLDGKRVMLPERPLSEYAGHIKSPLRLVDDNARYF